MKRGCRDVALSAAGIIFACAIFVRFPSEQLQPQQQPISQRAMRAYAIREQLADPTIQMTEAERAGAEQAAFELETGIKLWSPMSQREY